ncbi:hypothetical protein ROE7235_03659 [Roseibaca ekhonensis]|uniref:Uncharacterized protein n=1 Tax=Roseinatronobacter ekhonensis TaxID=254356 RepID=A0A3B0MYT7_9RHOB|nr:hypothetical protein [Roseibaca ekhonensis]SUZ33884.1 hypothetical protein ROE7235_03659 [Roseibaca ekhonensis]
MTRAKPVPETVTVHIPFRLVKRGGRKEMQMPDGAYSTSKIDNTLVKALARAFRWKRMLESGEFTTIAELAEREGIAPSFLSRSLRMTLLAPHIVEATLAGKQGPEVTLEQLREPFPVEWVQQLQTGWIRVDPHELHRRDAPISAKKEDKNDNDGSYRQT